MDRSEPRTRGILLRSLDRSQVYRIGFVGKRWEVLGPEGPTGPAVADGVGDSQSAERREAPAAPRHAAPVGPPPQVAPPHPHDR